MSENCFMLLVSNVCLRSNLLRMKFTIQRMSKNAGKKEKEFEKINAPKVVLKKINIMPKSKINKYSSPRPSQEPLFHAVAACLLGHSVRETWHDCISTSQCPAPHPVYFFLSHLSFVGLCFSSNVTSKMLEIFLSEKKTISCPAYLV